MLRLLFYPIHDIALMPDREQAGRKASPSAGMLDSQTVKAPHAPSGGGYDAAKRTRKRKRRFAVDTRGRLLMVNLTTADVQSAEGGGEDRCCHARALVMAEVRVRRRRP